MLDREIGDPHSDDAVVDLEPLVRLGELDIGRTVGHGFLLESVAYGAA